MTAQLPGAGGQSSWRSGSATTTPSLNNVGSADLQSGKAEGVGKLERSLQLALDAGLQEHAARAYTNLASISVIRRDYELADR
jgi:hypothetical protein